MTGRFQNTTIPCIVMDTHQSKSSMRHAGRYYESMKHDKQPKEQKRKQWRFQKSKSQVR